MSGKGKEATQRLLAIIVIIAMMTTMGIPPPVIIFFAIVIYFVWRAVQLTERQETNRIFEFYVAANDILRDEERRWYGFEIAKVISIGERIFHEMEDAPPLVLYALGALHMRMGDYQTAQENLAQLVEQDYGDESRRMTHSAELTRYVETLRRLEREPAEAPQTMAALRSLERARRTRAADMLAESRTRLEAAAAPGLTIASQPAQPNSLKGAHGSIAHLPSEAEYKEAARPSARSFLADASRPANAAEREQQQPGYQSPPAPIAEVLRDIYDEEKKTA